ncbi:immunity 49 family protein [Streptomyces sp. NBC_00162]|uniref:immunity 49 family protein n=1 Tax=Streptomyces sp. NBC_00162 TaxID=2903629 RepID=UPI00214C9360|nr:immunity 49 family protein [Streptomyces sp. NBC_00162]UUU38769.1 immunity 49 family protein [Streptomyces sp. NBC_00162]
MERHRVDEAALSAAREDFANRIGGQVHSMAKAGPVTGHEWWLIAKEFLDYLGALSVENPDLDTPEAKAALGDAAEAAAGAVAYAAYYPHNPFDVFLTYADFGLRYDPEADGSPEPVGADRWIEAFCLAVLVGKTEHHGEAFHFARPAPQPGSPSAELINGLLACVSGDIGKEYQRVPPSREEKLAALDAALARIGSRQAGSGEDLAGHPHSAGLRALRALTRGDREAFRGELAALLLPYASLDGGPAAAPRTLLPLLPLALTALARRLEGWQPPIDTGYLPRALVTGFETAGPRVAAYGRARRPDAVAALAAGPLTVERPARPRPVDPEAEALVEQYAREAITPAPGEASAVWNLAQAVGYQKLLFKARAAQSADATDAQWEGLRLAARLSSTIFRAALAEPGTEVEVTVDGQRLAVPADRSVETGPGPWHEGVILALITGRREDLAPFVLTGPAFHQEDRSAYASYRRALHAYLLADDPEPATGQALADAVKARDWGFPEPPVVLLSQLVEGDEESFNLALLDALEAHRDHYLVGDRAERPDTAVALDVLALACHARRRGWNIKVSSAYLPPRLLEAAEPI